MHTGTVKYAHGQTHDEQAYRMLNQHITLALTHGPHNTQTFNTFKYSASQQHPTQHKSLTRHADPPALPRHPVHLAVVNRKNHVTDAHDAVALGGASTNNGLDIHTAVGLLLEENAHASLNCSRCTHLQA
jgi:hypothetical protein